jgi:hypothetical protein
MGRICYIYTSSTGYTVPSATKCICYFSVGGGGGGAYPQQVRGGPPAAGGATYYSAGGPYAGGGGPGNYGQGGSGGYGNYSYGQTGYLNYSGGGGARASSGYGPYGQGGAGQWRSGSISAGGGGGGASRSTVARGCSGAIPGQYVSWTVGSGGRQGGTGTCRYGINGAVYISVCTYDPPSPSITGTPLAFRRNGSDGSDGTVDLTWSTSGGESTSEILERLDLDGNLEESYGQVNRNQSSPPFVVAPVESSIFRLTTSNPAYTRSDSVTVYVYQEPVVTLVTQNDTIVRGQSTNISWIVEGDASTFTISPGIGQSNLSGNQNVSPTVNTTYVGVASGLGGTGSGELEITVLQPPTITAAGPLNVLWGQGIPVSIEATNAPGGISYVATYYYTDGSSVVQPSVDIPNSAGDEVNIQAYTIGINYDDTLPLPLGPENIDLLFTVDGYGDLTATFPLTMPIIIDETPNVIDIPESDDTFRDENPVVTPDVEVTTQQIVVDDIDIPVEIKADYPIQVEIDNDGTYQDVRQI